MRNLWKRKSKLFGHLTFDEKISLQIEIMKAIKDSVEMGFLFSVEELKYNKLTTPRFRQDFGTAYTLLTQTCVEIVGEWSKEKGNKSPISYVFEEGHKNFGQAMEHLREAGRLDIVREKYLLGTWAPGRRQDFPPLMAADVLAHASYGSEVDEVKEVITRPPKMLPLAALGIPWINYHCTKPYIEALVSHAVKNKGIIGARLYLPTSS